MEATHKLRKNISVLTSACGHVRMNPSFYPSKLFVVLLVAPFVSYYLISAALDDKSSHSSRNFSKAMQSLSSSSPFFAKPFTAFSRSYPRVRSQLTDQQSLAVADPSSMAAKWAQKTVVLPPQRRGCHLVTSKILKDVEQDLSGFKCGLAHFFLQHTSASLTINENYDSDVRDDTETFLNRIVPEGRSAPWKHTMEGPDDMPAHIKSSMFGNTLTIPITDGRLNMGTWQGIWLCEHRDHASPRKIVVTLNGM